jgi:hypothetical protein
MEGNRILENIVQINLGGYRVRCWMKRDAEGPNTLQSRKELAQAAMALVEGERLSNCQLVAERIVELLGGKDRVGACEVVEHDFQGVVIYPDWP